MFLIEKTMIINLNSGKYLNNNEGNEKYNLKKEKDGFFYGYCPPFDNIDIHKNFNCKASENFIDGILVIYVEKAEGKFEKKVIAFAPNSRIYARPQPRVDGNKFHFTGKNLTFSIYSKNLYELNNFSFSFNTQKNIFHAQKIYGKNFPNITNYVISRIEDIFFDDDTSDQINILDYSPAPASILKKSYKIDPKFCDDGKKVRKNGQIAKAVLEAVNYKCQINASHKTFKTNKGLTYMEGHHLIPCSSKNVFDFWKNKNINLDCFNNIVCLCPNCHRAIHLGDDNTKKKLINILYQKQNKMLLDIGLCISEEELFSLYKD